MAPWIGLEPITYDLEDRYSILLSYQGINGHPEGTRTPKFHLERVMTVTSSSTGRYDLKFSKINNLLNY